MIQFKALSFKNFLSVGDQPIVIDLFRSPTTLITAPNGSGKSVMCDALTFALFDKSYRGINKSELVNFINKKGAEVELTFTKGGVDYKIIRNIKPNKFEIYKDNKIIDELAATRDYQNYLETYILGFNYKSFVQTCILGTANYIPFMQLPAAHRREVVETLFGINIFSSMNVLLKNKVSSWKKDLTDVNNELESLRTQKSMQENFVRNFQSSNDSRIAENKEKLSILKSSVSDKKILLGKLEEEFSEKSAHRKKLETTKKFLKEITDEKKSVLNDVQRLKNKIKEYENLQDSTCSVCSQEIGEQHVDKCRKLIVEEIDQHNPKIKELEQKEMEYNALCKKYEESSAGCDELEKRVISLQYDVKSLISSGKTLVEEIKALENSEDAKKLEEAKNKLQQIEGSLSTNTTTKKKLMELEPVYKTSLELLKDTGIKSMIINQYLPILNQRVNKYLELMNFSISFTLDKDFKDKLVSLNKTEYSYSNFSMGERQRIDLAMLFGWRDLANIKNSVNCNLLILDETADASLDQDGVEDLIQILSDIDNTNIFVVSHRSNLEDKFFSTIKFEKKNGFTKLVV